MAQFEIYWDDLTDEAKERLSDLNHGNVDLAPLAVIEVDNVQEIDEKSEDIEYIKRTIREWGAVTSGELQLESDPIVNSMNGGKTIELIERFDTDSVSTTVYVNGIETNGQDLKYEDLDTDLISEIREIVENYENEMEDTMDRASGYES